MEIKQTSRSAYLDVLKAIAIIAVVLFHSGFMDYGYLGVDIFLVISGYLTTRSLLKKPQYFQFLLNRAVRLLPLVLLAGTVSMIAGYFFFIDDSYESLTQSVVASNFFANNVVELLARGNYWRGDAQFDPLMHTWYVGLLMQFYVVYPLLFYAAGLDKRNPRRTLTTLLAVLSVLSFALFLGDSGSSRSFYLLPARFFEMGAGGLIALAGVSFGKDGNRIVSRVFVYAAYACLLALFFVPSAYIPAAVKRFLAVALTSVLVMSPEILENKVTGNPLLGAVGVASYSIYIWHQVILALYRNTIDCTFGVVSYLSCLLVIAGVSFLSYRFVEQANLRLLATKKGKRAFYVSYGTLFVLLNVVTLLIYFHAGIVRDIPELGVEYAHPKRGAHIAYTARGNQYNKPFETEKRHWLVIGNSFGLDFVNMILESDIADSVEVSFCRKESYRDKGNEERFRTADKVFISYLGLDEELARDIEIRCLAGGLQREDIIIVGEKYFGGNVNLIYSRRFRKDYFQTSVPLPESYVKKNDRSRELYGSRFLDLFALTCPDGKDVPVFSDDHALLSWDGLHLTPAGARTLGSKISWEKY